MEVKRGGESRFQFCYLAGNTCPAWVCVSYAVEPWGQAVPSCRESSLLTPPNPAHLPPKGSKWDLNGPGWVTHSGHYSSRSLPSRMRRLSGAGWGPGVVMTDLCCWPAVS